jgi:hypothetical protein
VIAPEGFEPPISRVETGRLGPLGYGASCSSSAPDSNREPPPSEGGALPIAPALCVVMDRPGFEPGCSPCEGDARPIELPARGEDSRSWDRTSSLRYVRPALSRLSYPRVNEKASEGSRTPVASLEDWCLDRSATEAEFPAGESNSALWVKSPVHHAPMLARDESAREESNLRDPAYQAGACTRLSYGREIRWGGLEPPPRGPQPRALPGELRTLDNRGTGNGDRASRLRAFAPYHMAPAGIEPATRWISPSRSTGELQEPGTKPTGFEPALSRETVGRAAVTLRLQVQQRAAGMTRQIQAHPGVA